MKKISFFLVFLFLCVVTAPQTESWTTANSPYLSGISKATLAPGEQVALLGKNFVAQGTFRCTRYPEPGKYEVYDCPFKTLAGMRLDKPELFPNIPFYDLQIVSIAPEQIAVVIPANVPSDSYEIYLYGLGETQKQFFGQFVKVKMTGSQTSQPTVSSLVSTTVPSPTSSQINTEETSEEKLSESQTELNVSVPKSTWINFFSRIKSKISQFFDKLFFWR